MKKMKNEEVIKSYNGLAMLLQKEAEFNRRTNRQLFDGRIKVIYAIRKNMESLLGKLKPYEESRETLVKEYRDTEAEQKYLEEKRNEYKTVSRDTEARAEPAFKEIWRDGKTKEGFEEKLRELLDIEVDNIDVYKIPIDVLDGLQLSSTDVEALMFMIE